MRVGWRHPARVALGHHTAVVDDEEAIRVGLGQHGVEIERPALVREPKAAEITLGLGELDHRSVTA